MNEWERLEQAIEQAKQELWDAIVKELHLQQIVCALSLGINNFWDWIYEIIHE